MGIKNHIDYEVRQMEIARRCWRGREWLVPFLAGPLLIGVFSLLSWFIFTGGVTRGPMRIEFVIPAGAAGRIAAGEALPGIPAKAVFVAGDVLVLRNEDEANHQFGPFWIPAGTALTIPLERPSTLNYLCTIHPSGAIGLEVLPRHSLLLTLVPAFLLGVPLGAVVSIVVRIAARLETT